MNERRGDVVEKDVWPHEHSPLIWLYQGYPNTTNKALVAPKHLMEVWRNPSHADLATYRHLLQNASWATRAKNWLRRTPSTWLKKVNDCLFLGLDDDTLGPPLAANTLPTYEPTRILAKTPKKTGPRLSVNSSDNDFVEAWGLELEENFRVHRLLFIVLAFFASASLAVIAWLLRLYGPKLPESPGPIMAVIAWIFTLMGLTLTLWFKWAEN